MFAFCTKNVRYCCIDQVGGGPSDEERAGQWKEYEEKKRAVYGSVRTPVRVRSQMRRSVFNIPESGFSIAES